MQVGGRGTLGATKSVCYVDATGLAARHESTPIYFAFSFYHCARLRDENDSKSSDSTPSAAIPIRTLSAHVRHSLVWCWVASKMNKAANSINTTDALILDSRHTPTL